MKKTDEKKKRLVEAYNDRLQSFGGVCKELGISRQSAYKWLAEEGVKFKGGAGACKSKAGFFAATHGISMPTARKYIAAQARLEKEGLLDAQGLRELGIGKGKQRSVFNRLEDIGLGFENMRLSYKGQFLTLNVEETIELFRSPIEFLRRILK